MITENENSLLPDQLEQPEHVNVSDDQQRADAAHEGTPESERAREEMIRNMPAYLRRLG